MPRARSSPRPLSSGCWCWRSGLARYEARREEPESLQISFVLASALLAGAAARTLLNGGSPASTGKHGTARGCGHLRRPCCRLVPAQPGHLGTARRARPAAQPPSRPRRCLAAGARRRLGRAGGVARVGSPTGSSSLATGSPRSRTSGWRPIHALGFEVWPVSSSSRRHTRPSDASVVAAVGLAGLAVAYYAFRWRLARPAASQLERLKSARLSRQDGRSRWPSAPQAQRSSCTRPRWGCWRSVSPPAPSTGARSPVKAFWGAVAAAFLIAARRWEQARTLRACLGGSRSARAPSSTTPEPLDAEQAGVAGLALGGSLLAAAIVGRFPWASSPSPRSLPAGAPCPVAAGSTAEGFGLLAVAAPFAVLATFRFSDGARSTALWASALGLALVSSALPARPRPSVRLGDRRRGRWPVLAELRTRERRLQIARIRLQAPPLHRLLAHGPGSPPAELLLKDAAPAPFRAAARARGCHRRHATRLGCGGEGRPRPWPGQGAAALAAVRVARAVRWVWQSTPALQRCSQASQELGRRF